MPKAIVLLSGGLDSSTTLAIAKAEGFSPYAITFRYGQRHELELAAARTVARRMEVVEHLEIDLDLVKFGGSALTDSLEVPKHAVASDIGQNIPVTYVPARNTIFLSLALAWAEVLSIGDIFIGVNALDYSGYPDCRPEYIAAFQAMANLATKAGVQGGKIEIRTPLIQLTKAEIIRQGLELGVDYSQTISCYDPAANKACGHCDACLLRLRGFEQLGISDPILYASDSDKA